LPLGQGLAQVWWRGHGMPSSSKVRLLVKVPQRQRQLAPPAAASVMEEGLRRLSRPSAGPCSTEASVGKADKSGTEKW